MNRFIAINPDRCVACGTCRAECSQGHLKAGLLDEPRLALFESRDVVASVTCHHCAGAPCLKVCPQDAIRRDDDGCIRVDEHVCIGCKLCAVACPFGAIHMYGTPISGVGGRAFFTPTFAGSLNPILRWEIGVPTAAVKCDLCAFDNCQPHCVRACPTNALHLVENPDDDSETMRRRVEAGKNSLTILDKYQSEAQEEGR